MVAEISDRKYDLHVRLLFIWGVVPWLKIAVSSHMTTTLTHPSSSMQAIHLDLMTSFLHRLYDRGCYDNP